MRRALIVLTVLAFFHSPARGKPDRKELEKLLEETDAIAAKVAKIRGLEVKKPIARGIMSRPEIEKRVITLLDEEYDPAEIEAEARAAKVWGLLPRDADYRKLIVELLGEQIAGFYDPTVKQLYLADWIGIAEQRIVMAHEIDHALQDQHFDLLEFTSPLKDNADAQLARQALVEGDGVALMVEFMFAEFNLKVDPWMDDTILEQMTKLDAMPGFESFDKAPLYLRESLMFPYVEGLRLVAATRRHHPWTRVDAMYKKPPESTEQVMHPEKYFAGEKPVTVKAAATLPSLKKWKLRYQNVLGEMGFSVMFRQHGVATARAKDAAAGWGGDRYALYAPADDDGKQLEKLVLVSISTWDEETDAIEAYAAAVEAVTSLVGAAPGDKQAELATWTDAKSGAGAAVERKGKKVLILVGAPKELGAKLRKEAWAKWK